MFALLQYHFYNLISTQPKPSDLIIFQKDIYKGRKSRVGYAKYLFKILYYIQFLKK